MGFKDLYGVGGAAGTAGGDVEWYTGKIQSWDDISGANTVVVNGVALPNLKVVQSGIGIAYQPGDVVAVQRVQTIYTVYGKINTPGTGSNNQIQANSVAAQQFTSSTSYTDLGTVGPTVTVNIGSSRRCLVLFSANFITITVGGTPTAIFIGGTAALQVSGASSISPGSPYCGNQIWFGTSDTANGFQNVSSQIALLTAADGLNAGVNTFTLKYRAITSNPGCYFADRSITVIPF